MDYVTEALERQAETHDTILAVAHGAAPRSYGVPRAELRQWETEAICLQLATPYYWNSQTVELVTVVGRDFNLDDITCVRHLLTTDHAWHWFAGKSPFEVDMSAASDGTLLCPVRAITWYWFTYSFGPARPAPFLGMAAYVDHPKYRTVLPAVWSCVEAGSPMSSMAPDERLQFIGLSDPRTELEMSLLRRFVVAASTFMRQHLLSVTKTPAERHARKRLQRVGHPIKDIHVVQLRRQERAVPAGGKEGSVDWHYQWTVRGHTRQQFYPSLNEHLPVWIHPYIKGPEGKPLKPRTTPVMAVVR